MSSANKPATYRSTFAFSVFFLSLIGLCSWLMLFLPVNHAIYDSFLSLTPKNTDKSVLMVSIPESADFQGEEQWTNLVDRLIDQGARAIVVLSQKVVNEAWWQRYENNPKLIVASRLLANELGEYRPLGSNRNSYISPAVKLGYAYRQWLPVVYGANNQRYAGFQTQLSDKVLSKALNINYWAAGLIPEISVDRLLQFGLITELVEGKLVLIGGAPVLGAPGYGVPFDGYAEGMSELQMQAYITHTVLSGKPLNYLAVWSAFLFMALILFVFVAIFLWVLPRQTVPVSLTLIVLFILSAGLVAVQWQVLLPVSEIVLLLSGALLYLVNQRYRNERQLVSDLVSEAHTMLAEKIVPEPLLVSDERWQRMMVFVGQQLLISRSVFLELDDSDRLSVAQFYNATAKDIEERRRDYARSPYVEARNAGVPV
ncbi:CHASE2 domain-containing protein, partial [Zhongshania sp.]|uniref:CHASE2 domain-containing protein n=1 Tax=Zhongshania sp. TaxID=1971902 RepID=UPI003565D38D